MYQPLLLSDLVHYEKPLPKIDTQLHYQLGQPQNNKSKIISNEPTVELQEISYSLVYVLINVLLSTRNIMLHILPQNQNHHYQKVTDFIFMSRRPKLKMAERIHSHIFPQNLPNLQFQFHNIFSLLFSHNSPISYFILYLFCTVNIFIRDFRISLRKLT